MKSKDFLNEGFVEDANDVHRDHEVQMARKDCYHAAENAIALHKLLRDINEQQGLEGWVSAKITLAADYLNTVREYLEYEVISKNEVPAGQESPVMSLSQEDPMTVSEENKNPALGVDAMSGKEKLRPHTGVGPKPGTIKHKLGKMAHTAKSMADFVRGKPERMGHLEEDTTAANIGAVVNPKSKKSKKEVGELFGGGYKSSVIKR
jgi:hypothetical protein